MIAKETLGKIYTDLKYKVQDNPTVFELVQATQQDYIPELVALAEKEKLKTNKDFFIEVPFRRNSVMHDVIERYMKCRHTCPTPWYDTSVFHYDRKKDALFFLWHLPSYQECINLQIAPRHKLDESERETLKFVIEFREGKLLQLAKTLNGEIHDYGLTFFKKD